jgi:cell division protein FtsL
LIQSNIGAAWPPLNNGAAKPPVPPRGRTPGPRAVGSRAGRTATANRRLHRKRIRYAYLARVVATVGVVTLVVVTYLALMANVTRMNYELSKNAETQATLAAETARLDDQIARLESRERLAAIAAKLGMHDPGTFAAVVVPPVEARAPEPSGIALLSWLK